MSKYDRQILAIGEEGQRKIQNTKVAIVGLGGTGSQVVQSLAYLGVNEFILVDDDHVEETNLNRLIGGNGKLKGRKKTEVAAAQIKLINETAETTTLSSNLFSKEVFDEILTANIVFGCLDNDSARLVLNEICCAHKITLIDTATEIIRHNSHIDFGGRVIVCPPGEYCLLCAGQIDTERAKHELESAATRAIKEKHGYGLGDTSPAPAVVSLNGVIANLATTEFMFMVAGIRKPNLHLTYHASRGHVNIRADGKTHGCFMCEALYGSFEGADVYRYIR